MIKAMEDLQGLDADAVARAIDVDAGQAIPRLRESLADLKACKYGAVHTPASIAARAKGIRPHRKLLLIFKLTSISPMKARLRRRG